MVSNIFNFHPYLGKIPILANIFQVGWNHQPVTIDPSTSWDILPQEKIANAFCQQKRLADEKLRAVACHLDRSELAQKPLRIDVSENSGTPKSSILIRFSIINHPFWGTPLFGNTRMYPPSALHECFFSDLVPSCSVLPAGCPDDQLQYESTFVHLLHRHALYVWNASTGYTLPVHHTRMAFRDG